MAQDIRAGRAFVELDLNNSKFLKGLRAASDKLKSFGAGISALGATMSAAGGAIVGSMMAAVTQFSSVGDTLDKMSQRTGVSATALSELGYAAEQSGSSLDSLGGALFRMRRRIANASSDSGPAVRALQEIGLAADELTLLPVEEQFMAVVAALQQIPNESRAAQMAFEIFGDGAKGLLPMLSAGADGIAELRQEARDLNLSLSGESVQKAAALGDAFTRIRRSVGAVVYEIGSALSDTILEASETIKNIVVTTTNWVKENRQLVVTVFKIGAGLMAAGTAITSIGLTIATMGVALGGVATGLGAVGAVLGTLLSPVGLIGAALAGGVALWTRYSESGREAMAGVMGVVGELSQTFRDTFGGIVDAISSGNLALAGQIAMTGLKLAFTQGLSAIWESTGGFLTNIVDTVTSGFEIVSSVAQATWAAVGEYVVAAWEVVTTATSAAVSWLTSTVSTAFSAIAFAFKNWQLVAQVAMQSAMVSVVAFGGEVAHLFTVKIPAYLSWFLDNWKNIFDTALSVLQSFTTNAFTNIVNLFQAIKNWMQGGGFNFTWTPLMEGFTNTIKELPAIAEREMGPLEVGLRARLHELTDELNEAWQDHRGGAEARRGSVAEGLQGSIADNQGELRRLLNEVAQARQDSETVANQRKQEARDTLGAAAAGSLGASDRVVGTFSATALAAMGGSSPEEKMTRGFDQVKQSVDKLAEKIAKQTEIDQALLQEVRMGGMIA